MISKKLFDKSKNAYIYELSNGKLTVGVTDFGAAIQYLKVATPNEAVDVCLGFDNVDDYVYSGTYCGATVGRVANRIQNANFALNGKSYQLTANEGNNHLHGGKVGFDKKFYTVELAGDVLKLSVLSPDGEEGYPGELNFTVEYELRDNALEIRYSATVANASTLWSPTCHTYFNLNGEGNVHWHELRINASSFTPIDAELIPTGELLSVANTPFDFTKSKAIGQDIDADSTQLRLAGGYDHNFVLNGEHAATAVGDVSAIRLDLFTDMPGLQFYSGNAIQGNGKNGVLTPRQGFCLEPQYFPNAVNVANFQSPVLAPNETKRHYIRYVFSTNASKK